MTSMLGTVRRCTGILWPGKGVGENIKRSYSACLRKILENASENASREGYYRPKRYVLYNPKPNGGPIYISVRSKFQCALALTIFNSLCSNFVCAALAP
jgi:hypothetical protein